MTLEKQSGITRRSALAAVTGGLAFLLTPVRALAEACKQLVAADQGPFYPVEPIPYSDNLVVGPLDPTRRASLLYLFGRVVNERCEPVGGADVEIWQCDDGGQYKHPNAPKAKAVESGFLYFAKSRSGPDGAYRFRTLRPTQYEVFGLKRASHIHVRVKAPGRPTVTTEVYFEGREDDRVRLIDRIFQSRGAHRNEMIVALRPAAEFAKRLGSAPEVGALACEYDVALTAAPPVRGA
jgi:protocatechuate 3,4-dioxygenase, beta subunit